MQEFHDDGKIDDLSNLEGSPVAITSGIYDWVAPPPL